MRKTTTKTIARDSERAARVKKTSILTGVSKRQVYRVISGDQQNEEVLETYMKIHEAENLLLEAVKKAVPFN